LGMWIPASAGMTGGFVILRPNLGIHHGGFVILGLDPGIYKGDVDSPLAAQKHIAFGSKPTKSKQFDFA